MVTTCLPGMSVFSRMKCMRRCAKASSVSSAMGATVMY